MSKKICSKCKIEKSIDDFPNDKKHKDGKRSECKTCRAIANKTYKQNNGEKVKAGLHDYYLRHRDKLIAQTTEWIKNNKSKVAQYAKTSRLRHPENSRRAVAKWNKNNPEYRKSWLEKNRHKGIEYIEKRRALKSGADGTITGESFLELCKMYDNKCLCCGRSDVKLTLDHIVPLSLGGSHTIENIQPLCKSCNSKKFQKTIDYRPVVWEQL